MRRYAWLGLLAYYSVFSQNWVSAGMPGYNPTNIIKLTVDSLEDRLLAVGFTSFGENSQQYIMRYSEGVWDSLGIFTGGLFDAQRLMDTLFAGGNFYAINDLPIQKLAAYFHFPKPFYCCTALCGLALHLFYRLGVVFPGLSPRS